MKSTIFAILISLFIVGGAIYSVTRPGSSFGPSRGNVNNVSMVDGKQIIEIDAKGGYFPLRSIAKANIPTILKVRTKSTFDCSSFIRIPSMNVAEMLPNSGIKDIDLGNPKPGVLDGTCGMGMYPFEITFQE